jgi:hypothetical protein
MTNLICDLCICHPVPLTLCGRVSLHEPVDCTNHSAKECEVYVRKRTAALGVDSSLIFPIG